MKRIYSKAAGDLDHHHLAHCHMQLFLLHALPGTPFGTTQLMSQEMRDKMMAYYGLDRPPLEQYLTFLSNLIRGDFGYSLKYVGQSVNGIIAQTFPVSAQLGLQAYLLSFPIGIFFGIIAAPAAGPSPGLCSGGLLRAGRVGAGIYSGSLLQYVATATGVVPGGPVEGLCLHHPAHTDPGHRSIAGKTRICAR